MPDSSAVTAGTNATATQYNNLRTDLLNGKRLSASETDQATITINWNDLTKGLIRKITLGGNRTLVFSNPTLDQTVLIRLQQDGTGSRTVTWPSNITWPGGSAPTLSTGANKVDIFALTCTNAGTPTFDAAIVTMGNS